MTIAKFCPECGHGTAGAKFCPECGTATTVGGAPAAAAPVAARAPAVEDEERELWTGSPDSVLEPLTSRSTKYMLTSERIRVQTGMIGKKAEQLELFRVKDVKVTRNLRQRARGCGDLEVVSSDKTTPELTLSSVKDPDQLAEQIRKAAREARQRSGVRMQEYV